MSKSRTRPARLLPFSLLIFLLLLNSLSCSLFGDSLVNNRFLRSLLSPFSTFNNCNIPTSCYGTSHSSYQRPSYPASSSPYYFNAPGSSLISASYPYPSTSHTGHSYPPGYSTYYSGRYVSPLSSASAYYPQTPGASYFGYSMFGPSSSAYSWPSSSLISRLRLRDSVPKYMGRGVVNSLAGGITDLTCNFPDPSFKVISNAAWVKVLGPYNYHEPVPPFECNHPDCSLVYINAGNNLRFRVLTNGPLSTLRIYETQPLDRGIYRCTVTGLSPDGTTSALYQVVEFVH